jgi:hypothetical protein
MSHVFYCGNEKCGRAITEYKGDRPKGCPYCGVHFGYTKHLSSDPSDTPAPDLYAREPSGPGWAEGNAGCVFAFAAFLIGSGLSCYYLLPIHKGAAEFFGVLLVVCGAVALLMSFSIIVARLTHRKRK